jgi:hypothetical protein
MHCDFEASYFKACDFKACDFEPSVWILDLPLACGKIEQVAAMANAGRRRANSIALKRARPRLPMRDRR